MNDVVVIKNESFITDHELRNNIYIFFSLINDENEKKIDAYFSLFPKNKTNRRASSSSHFTLRPLPNYNQQIGLFYFSNQNISTVEGSTQIKIFFQLNRKQLLTSDIRDQILSKQIIYLTVSTYIRTFIYYIFYERKLFKHILSLFLFTIFLKRKVLNIYKT